MLKNAKRTMTALSISIIGVACSYHFLNPDNKLKQTSNTDQATARVLSVVNDVKKQDGNKLLWKPVRKGDLLYLGEKLKTSTLSGTKIEFLENGTTVDIEQETLIIVNKNQKKLSLQVIEGSLFVVSNKNLPELSVNTGVAGNDSINVKDGEFSYSVSKDGKANVEILKGPRDQTNKLTNQIINKFKEVKPGYGENVYIDPQNEWAEFQWSPLTNEYDIKIEIGSNRNNLLESANAVIDSESGKIKLKSILGTFYWRLLATNRNHPEEKFYSNTMKGTFKKIVAPTLIYPAADDLIQLKEKNTPMEFKWGLFHSYESITLEVFSENSTQPIIREEVQTQTFFSTDKISTPGSYTWKLTGKIAGAENLISGPSQAFKIYIGNDLQSPTAISPEDSSIIYTKSNDLTSAKNIILSWKEIKEATQYLITVKNAKDEVKELKSATEQIIIPSIGVGHYKWSVQSINNRNEVSKNNVWKKFSIVQLSKLSFNDMDKNVYFSGNFPLYKMNWTSLSPNTEYILKISQSPSMNPNEKIKINTNYFDYQIPKEGVYYTQVEAVNNQEVAVAASDVFTFSVTRPPTPPVPTLAKMKSSEATREGNILFEVSNYSKNYKVLMEIKNNQGMTIDQATSETAKHSFQSLPPGSFYLIVRFKDEFNQLSELSEKYTFTVPNQSVLAAPKLKKVKVR